MQRLPHLFLSLIAAIAIASPLHAAGETIAVHVPEMSCESCATALISNFGKRAEVATVEADIPSQTLTIALKADAELNENSVRELVTASGFSAHHVTYTPR